MATKLMFARLLKVDEAKREVSGIMVAEVPDKEGEIFDYESSKPYFKAWNRQFSKATAFLPEDERSLGNVREMHQAKAVGKLTACSYDDKAKSIEVTAKIVDDVAWKKCAAGVYTGFSIGGDYVDTWEDEGLTRYTARPAEASIVDNPCVPTAEFSLVRANGSVELRKFVQADDIKKDGKTKRVAGEDLKGSSFAFVGDPDKTETWKLPIHDASHVRNALARFDQTEGIPEDEKAKVKAKIDAAAEKFGVEVGEKAAAGKLKKGMYDVSVLAQLLQQAGYLQSGAQFEREMEQDDSTMPEELKSWVVDGVKILQQMVSEEGAELTGEAGKEKQMSEKATTTGELEKARHSKETIGHLQAIQGHADGIVKAHKAMKSAMGDMLDCHKGMSESLGKLLGEHTDMQGGTETKDRAGMEEDETEPGNSKVDQGELTKVLGQIAELLKKQQDEPVRKVAARVVTKAGDQGPEDEEEETKTVKKPTLVKNAHGDLDLDEEEKKKIAKSIYANPQVMAPLAK